MINVSNQFKKDAQTRRDFYITATCTLANGKDLDLVKDDFYIIGNGVVDSSDSSDFPIGVAIEKTATLCLVNDDDRFSEYNFNAARLVLFLNFDLTDGTTEQIRLGTYIVNKKPATTSKINLTLTDRMHYADKEYATTLSFPTTAFEVLRDSCQTCGIQLGDARIPNGDYIVNEMPEKTTHREVIGCVAMLSGGSARIDESDKLRIVTFNKSVFSGENYDGGTFRPWTKGEELDGGTFNPWTEGDLLDGGTFADMNEYHVLYRIKNLQIDTDDVIVTGVKTKINKEDYLYGQEGYVVTINNALISGNEEDALERIGDAIIGLVMRPFSCQHIAYPMATFLDPVYIEDEKERVYQSYLTNVEFVFSGYTSMSNTAKSAVEEETDFYSPNLSAVEQAKKETDRALSAYDIQARNMNELAANTFGYFLTTITQKDGSKITYLHNKPNLSESKTVYKKGIDGFFVTQDYQGTDEATTLAGKWKAGFDANGDAYLNILYAIGIEAEWINAKALSSITANLGTVTAGILQSENYSYESGDFAETGFYLDLATGLIRSKQFGIGTDGNAYFSGNLNAAGGTFSGTLSGGTVTGSTISGGTITTGSNFYVDSSGHMFSLSPVFYSSIYLSPLLGWENKEKGVSILSLALKTLLTIGNSDIELINIMGNTLVTGTISSTQAKARIVKTKNYDNRFLYCYEMPSPMFGDIGEAVTDENGECYIYLDDVFSETVSAQIEYQVFLQKEGMGDVWVKEKNPQYFIVKGTENLKFAWEIKVKQRDYEYEHLEIFDENLKEPEKVNYESIYDEEIKELIKEREDLYNEAA